jgi:hypothetical protein
MCIESNLTIQEPVILFGKINSSGCFEVGKCRNDSGYKRGDNREVPQVTDEIVHHSEVRITKYVAEY